MKALLIIDVQKDFLPGGALAVPEGDRVVPIINSLQEKFGLVVATQDWHPPDHGSFASVHEGKNVFTITELDGLEQILWPDHCVQETPGADFAVDLQQKKIEAVFRKGMEKTIDTYSGFYDNGHRKSTGLADYLRGKEVDEVYITGLAGDVCVYFTVLDGLREGFTTHLITDATRAVNMEDDDFTKALGHMRQEGAKLIESGVL
ncbi:MAG: bifunctional nicotinamidase/pyrazinamidase [Bacteroidetes bacterium]|jgi:nicotinamidase/pyrazinamidase|nr:bifunctional nicotinamidase/pyrazinamidase [Bacteroidota bacterium]